MKKILIIIFTLLIILVLWFLVSPLFITTEVKESLPDNFTVPTQEVFNNMKPEEKREVEERVAVAQNEMPKKVTEESVMPISETTVVAQGTFQGADSFHKGSGSVKLLQNGNQSIVRLEDFSVTNGPDLYVVLATNSNPDSSETLGEHVLLEKLKGNTGNQNYSIPDSVDLSQYGSIVIYCKAFGVVFAVASL